MTVYIIWTNSNSILIFPFIFPTRALKWGRLKLKQIYALTLGNSPTKIFGFARISRTLIRRVHSCEFFIIGHILLL